MSSVFRQSVRETVEEPTSPSLPGVPPELVDRQLLPGPGFSVLVNSQGSESAAIFVSLPDVTSCRCPSLTFQELEAVPSSLRELKLSAPSVRVRPWCRSDRIDFFQPVSALVRP